MISYKTQWEEGQVLKETDRRSQKQKKAHHIKARVILKETCLLSGVSRPKSLRAPHRREHSHY
jgi:hypothetical protein